MEFLNRNSMRMLEKSMNFLWTKQAAIMDNVSNAETPGYRTKSVTFEETFRNQLQQANRAASPVKAMRATMQNARPVVHTLPGINRMDDNGVNITEQSVEMMRTAFQMQYVMSAMNSELSALRTAARGQ